MQIMHKNRLKKAPVCPIMGLESLHRPKGKWKHMDQMNRSAAPNPILGSRFFVPDVEAHVWPDGRVYLYGSLDLPGRMEYCSDR